MFLLFLALFVLLVLLVFRVQLFLELKLWRLRNKALKGWWLYIVKLHNFFIYDKWSVGLFVCFKYWAKPATHFEPSLCLFYLRISPSHHGIIHGSFAPFHMTHSFLYSLVEKKLMSFLANACACVVRNSQSNDFLLEAFRSGPLLCRNRSVLPLISETDVSSIVPQQKLNGKLTQSDFMEQVVLWWAPYMPLHPLAGDAGLHVTAVMLSSPLHHHSSLNDLMSVICTRFIERRARSLSLLCYAILKWVVIYREGWFFYIRKKMKPVILPLVFTFTFNYLTDMSHLEHKYSSYTCEKTTRVLLINSATLLQ